MNEDFFMTEGELKVFTELISSPKTNKEIGDTLDLTEKAVKSHATNIYKRLKIRGRIELLFRERINVRKKCS